jgi:hypothetical protein
MARLRTARADRQQLLVGQAEPDASGMQGNGRR